MLMNIPTLLSQNLKTFAFATYKRKKKSDGTAKGFGFACRLWWGGHRFWIMRSTIAFVGFSLVDLIFISRYF
jgi:hypothetical protein